RLDVGDDVDDSRALARDRFFQSTLDLTGMLYAYSQRADVARDTGEVDVGVGPQLAALGCLLAAVGAIEAALRLVAAGVVVHHRHRGDVPAHRGLDLAEVIPEPGVAGEGDDRPLGRGALRAQARRER